MIVVKSVEIPFTTFTGTTASPGVYGPYSLTQFTKDQVDYIRIIVWYDPNWPNVPNLFDLDLKWDGDAGGSSGGGYSGSQPQKMGVIMDSVGLMAPIPTRLGVKKNVTRGDITMTVYNTFSARITIQALQA